MRLRPVLVPLLLTFTACDSRSAEEKRLEAIRTETEKLVAAVQRVADLQEADVAARMESARVQLATGQRDVIVTGDRNTTLLMVRGFPESRAEKLHALMEKEVETIFQGAGADLEREGWLRVGFKDEKTGLEVTRHVSELRQAHREAKDKAAGNKQNSPAQQ
ncbi:hypothetical protein LXT21_44510 [Myxococcus sp. K38C18041901]|uniref:hypothetical protein n=1 Tax=Myxococcus guangdongensis TaxID=2906760 RepID=UPI0020A763CE|nr:hypothetical protein [Myxococcus guangdongensis]MCP3065854.1 hypothetical protein [Myxococcus guangdongensis]